MSHARYLAATIVQRVTDGQSLSAALQAPISSLHDPRDRAFVQAICYGVCRFYARLDAILSHLLKKPMKAKDSDVHALILVGLYQLIYMRVPPHAVVAETVNASAPLKKPWSRGFINAVLREYLREHEQITNAILTDEEAQFAHPWWLINQIKKAWPLEWQAILTANNLHPPLSLRVNQRRIAREEYLQKLANAKSINETANGVLLDTPLPVESVAGFAEGEISVQDGAAQLAAECLMLGPQQSVLDACAAPGGKLTHILEIEPHLASCIAIEKDPSRVIDIKDNLARLGLEATVICNDVNNVDAWWDGHLFDRILLDAPCSASGVIRRHPDIKLLRQPSDIPAFAQEQVQMLASLWPLLAPGGFLLYATCSIFPEENVEVIAKFLANTPGARESKIEASWGTACSVGRQILPGKSNMDGFYYARLEKI